MACGWVVLVSLLVLTSAVRPEATNPDVIYRQRRDHETAERFVYSIAIATEEAVSPQVKGSAQTLSEDEIAEISPSSFSANKASAPEVTNSERQRQNEMRTDENATNERERDDADAPTDRQRQNVLTNRGEINKGPIRDDDDNGSRKEDKEPDAHRKKPLKNIADDFPLTWTAGSDVIVPDSGAIFRTRRDLRKLKRILEDARHGTRDEDQKQREEDFLPDDEGQEEGESNDNDDAPQSDEATPDEAFRRRDFSKRPKYYPDWGPKRTWRINMMRVWGKRSDGELGRRVKYWNRK